MRYVVVTLFASVALSACGSGDKSSDARAVEGSATAGLPVITELRGREHLITVHSSPEGPLFTVRTVSGELIAEGLSNDQLAGSRPELFEEIRALIAETEDKDGLLHTNWPAGESKSTEPAPVRDRVAPEPPLR